jgi:hypothetical protein
VVYAIDPAAKAASTKVGDAIGDEIVKYVRRWLKGFTKKPRRRGKSSITNVRCELGFTPNCIARKAIRATPPIGTVERANPFAEKPLDGEWLSIVEGLLG